MKFKHYLREIEELDDRIFNQNEKSWIMSKERNGSERHLYNPFLRKRFTKIFEVIAEKFLDQRRASEVQMNEFGCGTGVFSIYLNQKIKSLHCLDVNQKSLNILKKRQKGLSIKFKITNELQSFKCKKCIAIFSIYEAIKFGFDINQLLEKTNDLIVCDLNTDNAFIKYAKNYGQISDAFHKSLLSNGFSAIENYYTIATPRQLSLIEYVLPLYVNRYLAFVKITRYVKNN